MAWLMNDVLLQALYIQSSLRLVRAIWKTIAILSWNMALLFGEFIFIQFGLGVTLKYLKVCNRRYVHVIGVVWSFAFKENKARNGG